MPPKAPSFGSQAYWDGRFTSNPKPFEWLESPTATDPALVAALEACGDEDAEVLHIGCGTSLLSFHLRAHVNDPTRIHNIDYSSKAIEIGRLREKDIYDVANDSGKGKNLAGIPSLPSKPRNESPTRNKESDGKSVERTDGTLLLQPVLAPETWLRGRYMRWSAVDLLSTSSLLSACEPKSYSIIIDKSTSDSIACSDGVPISLPYPLSISPKATLPQPSTSFSQTPGSSIPRPSSPIPIHPLHILGLHLALIVKPGGRWISVSYSDCRFPFLSPSDYEPSPTSSFEDDEIPEELTAHGFPDPGRLWTLEQQYAVEVPSPIMPGKKVNPNAPKIMHWIYVLIRTEREVVLADSQARIGE